MVWDILLQAAVGLLVGAAVGYGVAAIVDALSRAFASLWRGFVASAKAVWSYVSEATEHFYAVVSQILDNNWSEVQSFIRQEFGYVLNTYLVVLFRQGAEVLVGFVDPQNQQKASAITLGEAPNNVQLPEQGLVTTLDLTR
jgi:hypothetical protein